MFTLNFCQAKLMFFMVVSLMHESMFSNRSFMMLQDLDLSESLCWVE